MSAADIQARIKKGLAKAVFKTGSPSSDKVYLVRATSSGGDGTPINPGSSSKEEVLLVDAIFKEYDKMYFGETIQKGDRELVANGDVVINQGDEIRQGSIIYFVVNVEIKAPTSDVLAYIVQVRQR